MGYSVVYHSKATDGARLAEMVRLPKMFEKWSLIFLEVTRRFFRGIGRISEDYLGIRFDRARLFEIVDCRKCWTLFDLLPAEDVSFAELVEFPRIVFFGSTRFFRITRTFAGYRSWLFYLSNKPNCKFWLLKDVQLDVVFPKIFCACLDSARAGFPKMFNNVRLSLRLPKITKFKDALFVELGGFPKINIFESAQFAELVGWPKIFDHVPFFSQWLSKMSIRCFPKVSKDRTSK